MLKIRHCSRIGYFTLYPGKETKNKISNQGLARSASSLNIFQGFIAILGILFSKKLDKY